MNPDLDRPDLPNRPPDDDQLGALVRGVVDDWRMPPQRLDQPTWRDRTRSGPVRRRAWRVRLGRPAAAALVATVVLAVTAVWLTAPRGDLGTVGESPAASEAPSVDPAGTPLPRLLRNGDLPSVTSVMVRAEGRYRLADLATGTLGEDALGTYTGPSALVPRPDGGWLCLCGKYTGYGQTGPTGLSLTLASVNADGTVGRRDVVRAVEGLADPDRPAELQYGLVDARIGVAPDGATAFFAWIARNGAAGWTSGVDLIDVAGGSVTSSKELAVDPTTTAENGPITRNAPSVSVSPAGDRILLSAFWFVEDPDVSDPGYGLERWTAPVDDGTIGEVTPLALQASDDCGELDGGLLDAATYYQLCGFQSGDLLVRRFSLDGTLLDDTEVPRNVGEFSAGSLVARSDDDLFIWNPVGAILSRVDLRTGYVTTSPAAASSGDSPLDALGAIGRRIGQWIAPSALAKLLLEPGLVISPDGSRVYALGVTSSAPTSRGSTGLYAFDAASLEPVGHWEPTADFTSVAVSADGRFVYASAQGGVDAAGRASSNGSSVTVFDAIDGSVRLIAGELGTTDLWFASPTLE